MPADGVCLQTCPDGSQLPETQTCPETAPPGQLCRDGQPVPADSVCMQTCSDGTRIPETQSCSEGSEPQVCRDGRPVPADGVCKQTCPDGSQVPERQRCATCPGGMIGAPPSDCRCPDNTVWNPQFRRCVPGTTAPRACPGGMIGTPPSDCRCPDNTVWNPQFRRCEQARRGNFGAIAFSPESGATGYTYEADSREAAEERALQLCGRGCRVVVWFKNACGALAVGRNNHVGTGWSRGRREAEEIAISRCSRRAVGCRIKVWACTAP